nr:uncharacterized protein LOC107449210 [Parasteatoda tepidariorum]
MCADPRSSLEYCVVDFVQENGKVAVVPFEWLIEDDETDGGYLCWFPPQNLKRNVLQKVSPSDGWDLWPAKVIHYSKTYKAADAVLKEYLVRSDVEMFSEEEPRHAIIPTSSPQVSYILSSTPPAPKRANVRLATQSLFAESAIESPLTMKEARAGLLATSAQCTSCAKNEGFYSSMASDMRKVLEEIALLRQDVNCVSQTLHVQRPDTEKSEDFQLMEAGEMQLLEVELESSEKFSKMVKNLGHFGGRDCNEVTRRILAALLSHEAACGFNWIGGYGKLGMKTFPRVLQMISGNICIP